MSKATRYISHGMPQHSHFAIFQPSYSRGGLDISNVAMGIGMDWTLKNPANGGEVKATLIARGTLLTDWPNFESISMATYGVTGIEVLETMKRRYPDMIDEIVELWTFRRL